MPPAALKKRLYKKDRISQGKADTASFDSPGARVDPTHRPIEQAA